MWLVNDQIGGRGFPPNYKRTGASSQLQQGSAAAPSSASPSCPRRFAVAARLPPFDLRAGGGGDHVEFDLATRAIGRICSGATAQNLRRPAGAVTRGQGERISSVTTEKPTSLLGPKVVLIATSAASRPRAIRMRPMRGLLWRASKLYQASPR